MWYNVNGEKYCSLLSNMNLVPNCPNYIILLYTLQSFDHSFLVFALIGFLGGIVKIIQISRVNPGIFIFNVTRFVPKFQITLNQHIRFNKQPCNNTVKWYVCFTSQDALWFIKLVGNSKSCFFHISLCYPFPWWRLGSSYFITSLLIFWHSQRREHIL